MFKISAVSKTYHVLRNLTELVEFAEGEPPVHWPLSNDQLEYLTLPPQIHLQPPPDANFLLRLTCSFYFNQCFDLVKRMSEMEFPTKIYPIYRDSFTVPETPVGLFELISGKNIVASW